MPEIVLDAYAARTCPVKTFNAFDPTLSQAPSDESLHDAFQGGQDFRADVMTQLLERAEGVVDLRGGSDWPQLEASALQAMSEGAPVILGAVLPLDLSGHRSGRAHLLVRGDDTADGRPGYWPVRVKPYRVLEKQLRCTDLTSSTLARPGVRQPLTGLRYRVFREGALLELAHIWRLLQAAGFASATALGGVVGNDRVGNEGPGGRIVWVQLEHRFIRTFSRTAALGYRLRSPLERYDHEHTFRVHVAEHALARTGVDDPAPVVRPIRVKECESCQWWEVCRPRMDDDDLSLRISKTPLDVRELQTLMGLGISTVTQLAGADVEALLPAYLPQTTHRDHAEQRLRQAHRRARMLESGVELERFSVERIGVPRSTVEVDLDIETTDRGVTYLWGALVSDRRAGSQEFHHFSAFTELSPDAEAQLAGEFSEWLLGMVQAHPDLLVFHYSDYEPVHLRALARTSGDPRIAAAHALVRDHFVDLFTYVRDNFVGVHGLGLKQVACKGAGFAWRDEEPGGLNSQSWFQEAVHGAQEAREAARIRVLEYNEDDVRATWAVREWLTDADQDAFG